MRRCACGCVCDRQHGDDGAYDYGCGAGGAAAAADQRVAGSFVGFHADGGHGQVGAVDGDHGGLGEAGFRVVFLDGGVDAYEGDYQEDNEVYGYGGLVHGAPGGGEEDVHDYCHGEGCGVHP